MSRAPVKTKADYYRRAALGEFGNVLPMWTDVARALAEWRGEFGLRSQTPESTHTAYHVAPHELRARFEACAADGEVPIISVMACDDARVFQGEVMRRTAHDSFAGMYLHYSIAPMPMRPALRYHGRHASGVSASALLRCFLWPSDHGDLLELLDTYDGHVVEFSCFTRALGTVPGRNTVIWEVRDY